ncbi:hypothetical protein, partial [Vibrio sp. Isolate30]|uniref:hypothetical protein n=1 Tax=Vibrio sp. Isolate30 TaxID=2908536 RepID=UPI001EFDE46D
VIHVYQHENRRNYLLHLCGNTTTDLLVRLWKCGSRNFYALIDSGGHINAALSGEQRYHPT